MVFDSTYIIFGYDIILLNMKYSIKYIISFRLVRIFIARLAITSANRIKDINIIEI